MTQMSDTAFLSLPEEAQQHLRAANERALASAQKGDYLEALEACLEATRILPSLTPVWVDAASHCLRLGRWQEAIAYATRALKQDPDFLQAYDLLTHVFTVLDNKERLKACGLQALKRRDKRFGTTPSSPPRPEPFPPPPSFATRALNILVFSLPGDDPRYSETAVLNALEQPLYYPFWTCRFYLDEQAPRDLISRLHAAGAQLFLLKHDSPVRSWPWPLWRLLALDDPAAHRIAFRNADAVIGPRDAAATQEWLQEGTLFHAMRDHGAHTALLEPGLWGVVRGALPPMKPLLDELLRRPVHPVEAESLFLSLYVWPYARLSLTHHDSVFGFFEAKTFPQYADQGESAGNTHTEGMPGLSSYVGWPEGRTRFELPCERPNGTEVLWFVEVMEGNHTHRLGVYPAVVRDGVVTGHIPARYSRAIQSGKARVRLIYRQEVEPGPLTDGLQP